MALGPHFGNIQGRLNHFTLRRVEGKLSTPYCQKSLGSWVHSAVSRQCWPAPAHPALTADTNCSRGEHAREVGKIRIHDEFSQGGGFQKNLGRALAVRRQYYDYRSRAQESSSLSDQRNLSRPLGSRPSIRTNSKWSSATAKSNFQPSNSSFQAS